MIAPDERTGTPQAPRGYGSVVEEQDGNAVARELLDAGRRSHELEQVASAAPGDAARWAAGSAAPNAEQVARLLWWRGALALGLEVATGRDARNRLPIGYWRDAPLGVPVPAADLAVAPPAYDHDARLAVGRWRHVAGAALAELLALAAASPEGWRAATTELWDLEDELRRRAAGWRLSEHVVRARAREVVAELSLGGVAPVEVRAVLHRAHRQLDLTVWWPMGIAPAAAQAHSDVGAEARVADLLGVAADGVTVRAGRNLAEADREAARLQGVDLVAVAAGVALPVPARREPADLTASLSGRAAPGPDATGPSTEQPGKWARPSRAALEEALRLHASELPWALRVDAVAPVAAWAAVIDTVCGAEIEIVAQWRDTDGVPGGEELGLRRAAAAVLGVPVGAVSVLGPGDLPLDVLVQLPETGVRLVPPWRPGDATRAG